MSKIYCGAKRVPKNARIGTMQECVEKSQIRYWGLNKIDKRIASQTKSIKRSKKKTRGELIVEIGKIRGKITRINKQIIEEEQKPLIDKNLIIVQREELINVKKELSEKIKELKRLEEMQQIPEIKGGMTKRQQIQEYEKEIFQSKENRRKMYMTALKQDRMELENVNELIRKEELRTTPYKEIINGLLERKKGIIRRMKKKLIKLNTMV